MSLTKDWHQPYTSQLMTRAGTSVARMQAFLYYMKEALLSHPKHPWTLLASSDGVSTVGLSDNWSGLSSIIQGVNDTWPGSWAVFRSPAGTYPVLYLVLSWYSSYAYRASVFVTTEEPDLSSLSIYRVPGFTGPYIGNSDWRLISTASGEYTDQMSALVASDGSFIMTSSIGRNFTQDPKEDHFLFLNRMADTNSLDPYSFVLGCSGDSYATAFFSQSSGCWKDLRVLHPDGTEVVCTAAWPGYGTPSMQEAMSDDYARGWKPFAYPMRVVATTTGKESYKGTLEDMWWGGKERPKWGQPGFDGEDFIVMQKGILWVPCLTPYRW